MVQAVWNNTVIAASDDTVVVERNHYFPPDAVADGVTLKASSTTTVCGWKGVAHYYNVVANGRENPDAAWYYPEPKPEAAQIKGRIAFWKGVTVS